MKSSVKRRKSQPKKVGTKTKLETKIAKIAKSVVMKEAETFSPINSFEWSNNTGQITAQNLLFFMQNGDSSITFRGEKVFFKNIRMKIRVLYRGAATAATVYNTPRVVRLMVFKTKDALTNTSTNIARSSLFRAETGTVNNLFATTSHVDLHKVTLLHDSLVTFDGRDITPTTTAGNDVIKAVELNIPLNKIEYFDADNGGYLKGGNYYFAMVFDDQQATINGITISCTYAVNLKDL